MEPKAVVSKKWICEGCNFTSRKKYVLVDHLKRCWNNPENRACKTCEHYQEKWRNNVNLSSCAKDIPIYHRPNDNCGSWETRVTLRAPDVDYIRDFKDRYTRVDVVRNGAMK